MQAKRVFVHLILFSGILILLIDLAKDLSIFYIEFIIFFSLPYKISKNSNFVIIMLVKIESESMTESDLK